MACLCAILCQLNMESNASVNKTMSLDAGKRATSPCTDTAPRARACGISAEHIDVAGACLQLGALGEALPHLRHGRARDVARDGGTHAQLDRTGRASDGVRRGQRTQRRGLGVAGGAASRVIRR
eukprot:310948-Pleurochrysis_carterae.AAC.1